VSALSDYLEQALINHIFRGTAYTGPGTVYVALYTAAPSDSGGGTEVSGGAYARQAITSNTTNWSAPGTGGTSSNNNAITFPTATASWGTITHIGILDASSGGNLLMHAALTGGSVTVNSGQVFSLPASQLTIQFA
jgi:hypothetical protein